MAADQSEPEVITIIEGPPPEFRPPDGIWVLSLHQGPHPREIAICQLRTFSGPKMIERCRRAWREHRQVYLDFPQMSGLRARTEILAARYETVEYMDVLYLWVYYIPQESPPGFQEA
jgi:hypothetical protein